MAITREQLGKELWQMLRDSVVEEFPEATEEEIQQHMATIANALSAGFFTMKYGE